MSDPTAPLLHLHQLGVRFGSVDVVREVSLTVAHGEKLALVGESGSGKTVTAQAILQLNRDVGYQGQILLEGRDVLALPERAMRSVRGREVAMIFQEPMSALNPLYTIGNQITEALSEHLGMHAGQAHAEAIALLARTGIPEPERKVNSYPFQLSGGQRQRAMIAMALACRPKLLIADEPTTALDVTVQAQILALLADVQREFGMAVLLITHDLNLVRRFADRVAVMQAGQIVETGAVTDVFARPQHPYTRQLLDSRPPALTNSEGTPQAAEVVRAESVSLAFSQRSGWWRTRQTPVLHDISLRLRAGHTLGIVGESGSGKTTLGLALLRLLESRPSGRVVVAGQDVSTLPAKALRALRRQAQVVFQDPFASLSPRMTVSEIVGEGLALHEPQLGADARLARVRAMLEEVGLAADCLQRYPHEFSGGQRQRIAIARALILRPQLLLLDEPTSALDVSIQHQVLTLLREVQQRYGVAYLFISHDLAVIRSMAHDVLVLHQGRVVESGPAAQVFAAPQAAYTQALLAAALG